jgi:hypothetical protein
MKKPKHADHAEPGGQAENFLCHVRGFDTPRRSLKRGLAMVSVTLRGLRVSRLGQKKS